jgi:hypothetical protein
VNLVCHSTSYYVRQIDSNGMNKRHLNTFLAWQAKVVDVTFAAVVTSSLLIGGLIITIIFFASPGASSAKAVEAGLITAEATASLVPIVFSSCTYSSSELLKTMISSRPKTAWLSLSKSL